MTLAAGSSVLITSAHSQLEGDEKKGRQHVAVGSLADATKTDTKKYPKYAAVQVFSNCAC
jgi:hypothetical protein